MSIRFILGILISIPFIPLLYLQGKRVRAAVPPMPSAKDPEGSVEFDSPAKPLQIITLGESTMAGLGVEFHDQGFTGTLARELSDALKRSVNWKVYAQSGYNAQDTRKDLVPQITESQADLIVIGLGANDAIERNTPTGWKRDIIQLIQDIRVVFPKTPIAFLNMPPIREFPAFTPLLQFFLGNLVELHGKQLIRVAADLENIYYNSEVISTESWSVRFQMDGTPKDFYSDGVHPSGLTYRLWAQDFAAFLLRSKVLS